MSDLQDPKTQPENPAPRRRWLRWLVRGSLGLGTVALLGAGGVQWFVWYRLTPQIETQVSQLLKRPVQVGGLERFTLTGVRFGPSSLPATAQDGDHASTEAIEARFRLLPLLWEQRLILDITFINASAYFDEAPEGRWVNTEIEVPAPGLLKVDINSIRVNNADVILEPQAREPGQTNPIITLQLSDSSLQIRDQNQHFVVELQGEFNQNSTFHLQADYHQERGDGKAQLRGQNLPISELSQLLPLGGIAVPTGTANGNLLVELAANELKTVTGTANFQGITAQVPGVVESWDSIQGELQFQGTELKIDRLSGRLGQIPFAVRGSLTTNPQLELAKTAFNLETTLPAVTLGSLIDLTQKQLNEELVLPPLAGELKIQTKLTGNLQKPELTGVISSTQATQVDRLEFSKIETQFNLALELDEALTPLSSILAINRLEINPVAGGRITGTGKVELKDLAEFIQEQRTASVPVDDDSKKLNPLIDFKLQVRNVPGNAIAQVYGIPATFKLGNVSAQAEISGPLSNLKGKVRWQMPDAIFSGRGDIEIAGFTASLENTVFAVGSGIVNITGFVNQAGWTLGAQAQQLDLNELLNPDMMATLQALDVIPPDVLLPASLLTGSVKSQIGFMGDFNNLTVAGIRGQGKAEINLAEGVVNAEGQLIQGRWQAAARINQIAVEQLLQSGLFATVQETGILPKGVNFSEVTGQVDGEVRLAGELANLSKIRIWGGGKSQLQLAGGTINTQASFAEDQWQTITNINQLSVSRLLQTNLVASLQTTEIIPSTLELNRFTALPGQVNGQVNVSGLLSNLSLSAIRASGQGNFDVAGGLIQGTGNLANRQWQGVITANSLRLGELEKLGKHLGIVTLDLPSEAAGVINGQARIVGNLDNLTLNGINGNGQGQLLLAGEGGVVNGRGSWQNGNWQAYLQGDRIALNRFSSIVEASLVETPWERLLQNAQNLPILDGLLATQVNLKGNFASLFALGRSPLQAIQASGAVQLTQLPIFKQPFWSQFGWNGEQVALKEAVTSGVNATGLVGVEFSGRGLPSLGNLDLAVNLKNFDLTTVPLSAFATSPDLISTLDNALTGIANFQGRLTGRLENLQLAGDLQLENLVLNHVIFDPKLAGTLTAGINQGLELKLLGEQDRIEVALNEKYVPSSFALHVNDAIAEGFTEGETLKVTLKQFPLEILALTPGIPLGITGPVTGNASGEVALTGLDTFDLNQIQAVGNFKIDHPGLDYIIADTLAGQIVYEKGIAKLSQGELRLRESLYELNGQFSLLATDQKTFDPNFTGKINVIQGQLQDVLVTLRWFNFDDIIRGLKSPIYGTAIDLNTFSVGESEGTLIAQLRRFAEIKAILAEKQRPAPLLGQPDADPSTSLRTSIFALLPPLEALEGEFQGQIDVAGSLSTGITIAANLQGENWQWEDYTFHEFALKGELENNLITILPLRIRSGETLIGFSGQIPLEPSPTETGITPASLSGQLRVENFPVAQLQNFVKFPPLVDVTGNVNLTTSLAGTLNNPQALGQFNLVDGTLNRDPIQQAQGGFNYNQARLRLSSNILMNEEDPIELVGSVPLPLPFASAIPDSDDVDIRVRLQDDGLKIINVITPEIAWVDGEAKVELRVTGTLEQPYIEGLAKVNNATMQARAFPDPLTELNGSVRFTGDRIRVEGIEGNLSQGTVQVGGVVPVLKPLSTDDPDFADPLTITLDQLAVSLKGLYQGGVLGQVQITGAALSPVIAGNIKLYDGQVLLPDPAATAQLVSLSPNTETENFEISLQDFQVELDRNVQIVSPPVLNFGIRGTLTVNGSLNEPQPAGIIKLTGGQIKIGGTNLRLLGGYASQAEFIPNEGLDPFLDVRLVTSVPEVSGVAAATNPFVTEYDEYLDLVERRESRSIVVQINVKGFASELENSIELTSFPRRTEAEIVALLGGGVIDSLIDDGMVAIANFAGASLFSGVERKIMQATGLSEFRIFPTRYTIPNSKGATSLGVGLEVGIDVTRNLAASLTKILGDQGPTDLNIRYRVNDNILLRGSSDFQEDHRAVIEYELRF